MNELFGGLALGLVLSLSVGPIFFAIVQASIRQGIWAGIAVGSGIWISDLLFILATYFGISQLTELKANTDFVYTFSIIGGIVLIIFGLILLFKKPPSLKQLREPAKREQPVAMLCLNGFLINTLNPFTVFFWLTVMTDSIFNKGYNTFQIIIFFGAILLMIMLSDFLKAYFADKIRHKLMPHHLKWFGLIAGIIIIGFGVTVIFRGITGY